MGVVYLAEQDWRVKRWVALKVIKPGMDWGARKLAVVTGRDRHVMRIAGLDLRSKTTGRRLRDRFDISNFLGCQLPRNLELQRLAIF
jgi:hypothetical protein